MCSDWVCCNAWSKSRDFVVSDVLKRGYSLRHLLNMTLALLNVLLYEG